MLGCEVGEKSLFWQQKRSFIGNGQQNDEGPRTNIVEYAKIHKLETKHLEYTSDTPKPQSKYFTMKVAVDVT